MALKSTGYLAEATEISFTGATQKLVSLANNEWTDESDIVSNSENHVMCNLELNMDNGAAAAFSAGAAILVYFLPSLDGSNYPDWRGGGATSEQQANEQYYVGSFTLSNVSPDEAQRHTIKNVPMPPGNFKVACRNKAGQTLTSGTLTLKYRPHSYQDT